MSWIVSNWRLKLLALALTIGLLGAVAFSENPIAFRTLPAKVDYAGLKEGIAILNPINTVDVQVTGLADTVGSIKSGDIVVRADVSRLKANEDTTIAAPVRVQVPNIQATTQSVPLHVVTDTVQQRTLDIEVRTPNLAPGWKVDTDPKKTHAECQPDPSVPCQVKLTGPTSLTQDVTAFVSITEQVSSSLSIPSQTVRFERTGRPVDFTKISTFPLVGWEPATVGVQVTATSSQAQRAVAVAVSVTGRPACGYAATGLTINPGNGVVQVLGPASVVTTLNTVGAPPIDIGGATGNVSRNLTLQTPDQVTAQPSVVTATVSIQKQFDCTAPTPTPSPSPSR